MRFDDKFHPLIIIKVSGDVWAANIKYRSKQFPTIAQSLTLFLTLFIRFCVSSFNSFLNNDQRRNNDGNGGYFDDMTTDVSGNVQMYLRSICIVCLIVFYNSDIVVVCSSYVIGGRAWLGFNEHVQSFVQTNAVENATLLMSVIALRLHSFVKIDTNER
jgi:hypothetical protein